MTGPGGPFPQQPPSFPPQPPHGYGSPPKKKRIGLWLGLAGAALVLVCCGGSAIMLAIGSRDDADKVSTNDAASTAPATVAGGNEQSPEPAVDDTTPEATATTEAAEPTKAAAAKLGSAVRDGKFEFVVSSVKCGATQVGGDFLNATAQGQFCLVKMSIKNIGDEPQTLSSGSQKGFNAAGQEYSADSAASLYVNDDQQVLFNEINPGNQVKGTIVFDIPKGQRLARLELHDSSWSGGVSVTV